MSQVTIERLSVQFDVEGASQDTVFAALFQRHIQEWSRRDCELKEREKASATARSLGGHAHGDH